MEIPTKLKVGGHSYDVQLVERVETESGEDNCGDCSWQTTLIRIKKGMPQSQREETLFHEALHALDQNLSEDLVSRIAFGFYQVLSDNNLLR